jgi:hypothetical protein
MIACHAVNGARHKAPEILRRPQMKRLMTLMLGLSLLMGATAVFAAPKADDTTKTTKKTKKVKKPKATTAPTTKS